MEACVFAEFLCSYVLAVCSWLPAGQLVKPSQCVSITGHYIQYVVKQDEPYAQLDPPRSEHSKQGLIVKSSNVAKEIQSGHQLNQVFY